MKNKNRLSEITILLQGVSLPNARLTANEALLPAQERASDAIPPSDTIVLNEAEDMTGLANIRNRQIPPVTPTASTSQIKQPIAGVVQSAVPVEAEKPISRTTQWRHNKKAAQMDAAIASGEAKKPRKEYGSSGCKMFQKALQSEGHKQYYGYRYCPVQHKNKPFNEWLVEVKAVLAARKATTDR